jgi:hypothetical protein
VSKALAQLLSRSRGLRARSRITEAMPVTDKHRYHWILHERQEALEVCQEMEGALEGLTRELTEVLSRAYELGEIVSRGSTGHSWKHDLPQKVSPTQFYQALRSFMRWLSERRVRDLES